MRNGRLPPRGDSLIPVVRQRRPLRRTNTIPIIIPKERRVTQSPAMNEFPLSVETASEASA